MSGEALVMLGNGCRGSGKSTSLMTTGKSASSQKTSTQTFYPFYTVRSIMTDENYKYCEHLTYGVGSAQLVKYRKDDRDDLFMCTFQAMGFKNKWFFPRKYFTAGDDVTFITEAVATRLYKEGRDNPKKKRTKTVRKKELNLGDLLDSFK